MSPGMVSTLLMYVLSKVLPNHPTSVLTALESD